MEQTNIYGKTVRYECRGAEHSKETVALFLHGWGATGGLFGGLLDTVGEKYFTLAPDLPGFGGSEEPSEPWDVDGFVSFVLAFLELEGFKLEFDRCSVCGEKKRKLFLDLQRGSLVCDTCRSADSSLVSARAVAACVMLDGMPYDKLTNLNFSLDILKDALQVCYRYVSHSFFPLKSLNELISIA